MMRDTPGESDRALSGASTPRQSGVTPHEPTNLQRFAAGLVRGMSRTIEATIRWRFDDRWQSLKAGKLDQAIYCVWHNRLALCMNMYSRYVQPRTTSRGLAAMVSASRDGAFLASILRTYNVQPIRGSTSRRGRQALLELVRWAERGYDLAITPDGPRGPCYHVQSGIISLAQVTRLPILSFSSTLKPKIRVKSWDRFQVPLPFARCNITSAEPLRVPRDAGDEEREALRQKLEASLMAITQD